MNLRRGGVETYVYCAAYLHLSLERAGIPLTVVTNNRDAVIASCPQIAAANVVNYDFSLDVPTDVAFRSAHHKLEILKYIGESFEHGRYMILDVDVVCVDPRLGRRIAAAIEANEACGYDIGDQVFAAYGRERVEGDIRALSGGQTAIWFGGEFLVGTPAFYRELSDYVAKIWPDYVARRESLHHQGDEAVVSAALCEMIDDGHRIATLSSENVIVRWWNTPTLHRPIGLLRACRAGLMHLPSDKDFISVCLKARLPPALFAPCYAIYAAALMPVQLLRSKFGKKAGTKFAPRLM
ncbi:hypothetical protein MSC49_31690 [Methylosinus sp. C49]|nr:hypothetical protein MSC49_31690 [Methylosinus sp. C49]